MFSENRLNPFPRKRHPAPYLRAVVMAAMAMGLVKGEGFAADASVMEANARRYHGNVVLELSQKATAEVDRTSLSAPACWRTMVALSCGMGPYGEDGDSVFCPAWRRGVAGPPQSVVNGPPRSLPALVEHRLDLRATLFRSSLDGMDSVELDEICTCDRSNSVPPSTLSSIAAANVYGGVIRA